MLEEISNKTSNIYESVFFNMPHKELLKTYNITDNDFIELCNRNDMLKQLAVVRYRITNFEVKKTLKNKKITIEDLV